MSRDGVALRVEKHTDAVIIKQNGFSQIINKRLETDRAYLVKIALHNIRISSYNVRQRTGKSRAARPRARPGCSAPVPLEITDAGIVSLSNICGLSLRKCDRVSPAAICRVVQCSPSMDWLYFYECKHLVPMDIVFGRLHQNVDGILESHKELMRNLLEWVENQKQVPREVFDVLGVEPPNSDSESDSDQGTYRSSSSEDYF